MGDEYARQGKRWVCKARGGVRQGRLRQENCIQGRQGMGREAKTKEFLSGNRRKWLLGFMFTSKDISTTKRAVSFPFSVLSHSFHHAQPVNQN